MQTLERYETDSLDSDALIDEHVKSVENVSFLSRKGHSLNNYYHS